MNTKPLTAQTRTTPGDLTAVINEHKAMLNKIQDQQNVILIKEEILGMIAALDNDTGI